MEFNEALLLRAAETVKRSLSPATAKVMDSKRVLVLGAGYVSPPCIECLAREQGLGVTVVSAIKKVFYFCFLMFTI